MMDNILSFDIEGSEEGKLAAIGCASRPRLSSRQEYEVRKNTEVILNMLDMHNVKATFFVLSHIVKHAPEIGHEIVASGNEIASHGASHIFLDQLSDPDIGEYVYRSKVEIEDALSIKVKGFRAPFFSICNKKEIIFDCLKKNNFLYDSSVFPIAGHDLYGCEWNKLNAASRLENGLIEFPLSTAIFFGKNIPVFGGGYFRFLPLAVTKTGIKIFNKKGFPAQLYLHPYEVGDFCEKFSELTNLKKLRFYYSVGVPTRYKLRKILETFSFTTYFEYLQKTGYLVV